MYKYVIIISLAILALPVIFGCSDKSTESNLPPDDTDIRPNLTIRVTDEGGVPLYRANVTLINYLLDTTVMLACIFSTNEAGIFSANPLNTSIMLDSLTIIISKTGYLPDTTGIKILYDGQVFYYDAILKRDSLL